MNSYFTIPAVFVFAFLGSLVIIRLARSRQWLDAPNGRSSHKIPTPTGGGIAFVSVFILGCLLLFRGDMPGFNHYLVLLLGGCIAGLGLVDDICNLGIVPRICVQLFVVAGALALFGVPAVPLPYGTAELGLPGYLVAACGFLWFINLFNFMDGIDGIAASETLFICLAIFAIALLGDTGGLRDLLLVLVAAVSGFLVLNISPARIFMGDVGSNFLGYMIGLLALSTSATGLTNIWVWCILTGLFVVDATNTLVTRMLAGETWYYAHRNHAYQLAAGYFNSHGRVVMLVLLINCCWLLPLAWLAHHRAGYGLLLTLAAWVPLLIVVRMISKSQTFRQ